MKARRHLLKATGAALAALVLAGCATPGGPTATAPDGDRPENWSGRMSLRIDSEPVQTFSALFDLRGGPERGTLTLTTPIGSTLAQLQWSPGEALLKNGNETRRYPSVDALIEAATGASIPVGALFGWLAGRDETVPGWRPDLSQRAAGRLQAVRDTPLPRADLRIAFARE
ncbi:MULTISPECIES: lipoprotein insertase outer membrane protein LolB [unclassified Variovorax]|uniref:lipoprotein insertase outer membrane protein LolB n=1 Tax=unclassified Variovorax TaxID=663243 RepID=UPI002577F0DC|nr:MULTISPECIES: lipoprotein insertase outer membrane protein LolB [unclassified Variovorax]MDM0091638.1 lipoprotein insertase outer membrane protein LolB [Variovorax sp. J22G40]MDM0145995.1 lipoprotein insertase outer membrane protein LolB [Variovorax sp. J2P1-31]